MDYAIHLTRDGFSFEEPEIDYEKPDFEDLPAPAQEAIIDLIVSIIKNKQREEEVDKVD